MINGLAGLDKDFGYRSCLHGTNLVVHLHGVKDGYLLAASDGVARLDVDFENDARHRGSLRAFTSSRRRLAYDGGRG